MMRSVSRRLARLVLPLTALAALSLVAAPARATISPQAKAVLDHYVQAVGGPAHLAWRTIHTKSIVKAFMMEGTVESWMERPDHSATRFAIGPLKVSSGDDGTTAWRTDPSGKMLRLDGKDLEDARGGNWLEFEAFLLPDQGGGDVSYVGEESDSAGRYAVLDLKPPAGRTQRVWFDLKTGLSVRSRSARDQQTIVTRYSDYRTLGGRLVAARTVTELVGSPMNTITATVESLWVDEPAPPGVFSPPSDQGAAVRYLKTPGTARLPYEYRSRHVWVRASVNGGPPADFVYDTGASITVIDSVYAAKIGLKTEGLQQGQGAGATGSAAFAVLPSLTVQAPDGDGIEIKDLRVAVLNVNQFLAPYFWRDCAGVVGFDFIDRFVNEIDFDRSVITLYEPKGFTYAGKGTAIPMTLAGHTPVVKMKLDGAYEGDFRVDVGSGSTVDLHTPFVKKHDLMTKAGRGVDVTGAGFGGTFTTRLVRMQKLEIGPYAWADPLVSLSQATTGAFTSEDYAGNIGTRILERFKVTLDYERRQMWLEPGGRYARRDPMARAGMQMALVDDTVRVMAVLEGSAAQKAGVREGDVVTALDGKPIREVGADGVEKTLEQGEPGSTHALDVVRDGRAKKVKVKLREML